MRVFVLIAALAMLAACSVRIDERSVFRPQPHPAQAQTVEELSRWPIEQLRAETPDAMARHGFMGEGDARIAYTLVSRPVRARARARRPLIVYCGGNGGDRYNSGVFYAQKALTYGDVLLFDYPGYGDSPGQPSAQSFDAMAPLVSQLAVRLSGRRPLIFWGHSLGGFVCSRMARDTRQTDGVILEATARNAIEIAHAWRPWFAPRLVRIRVQESLAAYDVATALSHVDAPILVLGARRDPTLPVRLSRSLADALRQEGARVTYVEFPFANHIDISRQPEFPGAVSSFFASVTG
jgi:pimeloyl-ACP methyl ester carboxylesterase